MAREHLDFSLALLRALAPVPDRSYCWSPYSVASALGLAATATAGPTREELAAALRVTGDVRTEPLKLLSAAADPGETVGGQPPVLAVANTLWMSDELTIRQSFRRAQSDWPGSAVRTAPFGSSPEEARRMINSEIADTTRGLIRELLAPGTVAADTLAALVNALYLKIAWREPFKEAATEDKPFHAPGGTRDVPTMHAGFRCGYGAGDGWQVVTLRTAGSAEAVILLPDGELAGAEQALDGRSLAALLSKVSQQRVELFLPRFEVTGKADLLHPLASLGVGRIFTPAADFSPLTDSRLCVSKAVHQAVLRVDESGLEGAAATALVMRMAGVVRDAPPIRVDVDRPFLFLVRHRESGALYFMARVVTPG